MQTTSRRRFIQQTSLLSAGFLFSVDEKFKSDKKIGLQLFTVRDLMAKDPKGTLQKIGAIGYREVESFGYSKGKYFGMTPQEFKAVLKQSNLSHPSGHYGLPVLTGDWDQAVKDAVAAGQKYMVIAYLTETERKTIEDYKHVAKLFNEAAAKCKKAGIQFAYHNHDFEFKDMNGQHGYDILVKETDPKLVKFELDLYWATKAGHDPIQLFNAHPGRFPLWHVKDMDNTEKKFFTEVGNGTIDFKKIFDHAKKAGMNHFFVEQDVSPDPLASIAKSYTYIKSNLLKELS